MKKINRFNSLKTKIMVSTIVPVIASFALIGAAFFLSLFNSLHNAANAELMQISQKYAHNFENKINEAMNYLSILTREMEVQVETGSVDREALQKKIFKIFEKYKVLDGSSVYFETNRYDGKDTEYVGTEYGTAASGRICWYFYVDGGKTAYLPEGLENDVEFSMPFYMAAKTANKPVYTDPVTYEIDGRNIPMFTLTYPIKDTRGNFIGAATVDLFLDDIYAQLQNEKIYETGYVIISNDNNQIIYSPRYEDIGGTMEQAGLTKPLRPVSENSPSIIDGKDSLVATEYIYIPQLDRYFYISVTAPLNEIDANGAILTSVLIGLCVFVVVMIAFLLFYLIEKISAPLDGITESVNKIANGDYNARIKGVYSGEFAVVKDSVNAMADSIEAYIKEAENSLRILKNILNGLDAVVYVTVPETDEILFLNDYMKEQYKLEGDVTGRLCYEVVHDEKKKCPSCPCRKLDKEPEKTVVRETHSAITKRDYRNTDRYIEWVDGRKVHLHHAVDITDIKMAQSALNMRLKQQSLMASISRSFLSDDGIDTLIPNALRMTGEFMGVAQILHYELGSDGVTFTCQNEWINPDVSKQSCIGIQQVLTESFLSFIKSLSEKEGYGLNSNDPALKETMAPYMVNFNNYISTPIFVNENLYGALDFFKEEDGMEWTDSEISLATLVSSLLSGVFERQIMEAELIKAKDLAEHGSRAKSDFLSNMSHEIRTPMNAIIGIAELLLNENLDSRRMKYVKEIDASAKSLLGIINDILDQSKISEGKLRLIPVDSDITVLLKNVSSLMSFSVRSKGLDFIEDIRIDSRTYVKIDETRITQVLLNLLSNAVKFTNKGFVKLEAKIEGGNIIFIVADTGMGIKSEEQSMIFSAFEQADVHRNRNIKGTGLGLSISRNLVEMMSGEIWFESEYGAGTSFFVTIPYVPGEEPDEAPQQAGDGSIMAPMATVLLVDDIQANLTVGAGLMRLYGISADIALSGQKAIELVKEKDYDIVFMDHMMPEEDGIEVTKKIRALGGKYEKLPIVALTANALNEARELLLSSGMDDFLPKPIERSELLSILKKWLPADKIEETSATEAAGRTEFYSEALWEAARIDGMDIEPALKRLGGMQDVLEDSIRQTAYSISEKLHKMDECLSNSDLKNFSIEAHGFKSSLANIGAAEYSILAAELETSADADNYSQCSEKFAMFNSIMESFSAELRNIFSETGNEKSTVPGDAALLLQKVHEAIEYLESFETDEALACVEELLSFTFGDEEDNLLIKSKIAIGSYDHNEAIRILRQLG